MNLFLKFTTIIDSNGETGRDLAAEPYWILIITTHTHQACFNPFRVKRRPVISFNTAWTLQIKPFIQFSTQKEYEAKQGLRVLYLTYSIWCGYTLAASCEFLLSLKIPYHYHFQLGQICIRTIIQENLV